MFALQPELKVFTGSANRDLAERICKYIGVPLGQGTISSFPDSETYVRIEENIRGHDVFIVQPTSPPTNQHLMELLIMPKSLIITEKPSVAGDIAKALGGFKKGKDYFENERYLISWAVGHLFQLAVPASMKEEDKWDMRIGPSSHSFRGKKPTLPSVYAGR